MLYMRGSLGLVFRAALANLTRFRQNRFSIPVSGKARGRPVEGQLKAHAYNLEAMGPILVKLGPDFRGRPWKARARLKIF